MTSIGFSSVEVIILPKSCAMEAVKWLYYAGTQHVEGVALWAGVREGLRFKITKTIIPLQKAGSLEDGLIYVVPGDELHRIGLELFNSGLQLIAQIHSHPQTAYHSDTDDAYPIVTVLGGVSVVVPNFARGGVNLSEWAVYRLVQNRGWVELSLQEKLSFIQIVDDSV